jgi:hypothetical protein
MLYIAHRINTIAELQTIPLEWGVEIDLRDCGKRLILQHDPFKDGEDFEEWCKEYKHALLILNIKSEGIEWRVLEICKKYGIENFFFLDSSIPMIMKLKKEGERRIAVRYSEVEDLNLELVRECQWVWIDCFTKYPDIDRVRSLNTKCCLVGPALQGHNWAVEDKWRECDAVCDKKYNFEKWILNVKVFK